MQSIRLGMLITHGIIMKQRHCQGALQSGTELIKTPPHGLYGGRFNRDCGCCMKFGLHNIFIKGIMNR